MYIAVAGNIGSGKSTLTQLLARHYGWEACFESVDNNPYLEDYYRDIHRWSFNLEVYFLKERFRALLAIRQADHTIIQDRTIYEGVHVFMANNKAMGNLSDRDHETYMELFHQMTSIVRPPDLMIYLRASVPHLVGNIQKRGDGGNTGSGGSSTGTGGSDTGNTGGSSTGGNTGGDDGGGGDNGGGTGEE